MTEHPLTDDRCDDIAFCYIDTSDTCDNMRAARAAAWSAARAAARLRQRDTLLRLISEAPVNAII